MPGCVADVEGFQQFFQNTLSVPTVNIQVLLDKSATRVAIIAALKQLSDDQRIQPGDAIFVSYAGRSISEECGFRSEVSIVPYDWCDNPDQEIRGVPLCDIGGLIEGISKVKGNNITVVLDCSNAASGTGYPDSHVLLAACGASESAGERKGHRLFSHALLEVLQSNEAFKLTYSDIVQQTLAKIQGNNTNQHPQCLGLHRNRYLFGSKDTHIPPTDPISPLFLNDRYDKLSLYAGSAHGLAIGDQLRVYPARHPKSPVAEVVIHAISCFQAELKVVGDGRINFFEGFHKFTVKPMKTPRAVLKLALPPYQHVMLFHSILRSPVFQRIISTVPDDANLSVFRNDDSDGFSIQIIDPRVAKYGSTPWFEDGRAISPADLPCVLHRALKYYWELDHIDSSGGFPLQHIRTEFHKLDHVQSLSIKGGEEVKPIGPNLYQSGEVHLNLSNSGLRCMYGMKITFTNFSETASDIHSKICYFCPDELSVETVCGCLIPDYDERGKKGSKMLIIGYDPVIGLLELPMLKDNDSVRVDFIKIFLFIRSLNRNYDEALESGVWGTITIPIIQHRDALAQPPSPNFL